MSIRLKITLLFLGSLILMIFITVWVQKNTIEKSEALQINTYLNDAKVLLTPFARGNSKKVETKLLELQLQHIQVPAGEEQETLLLKPLSYGQVHIFKIKNLYYLKISYLDEKLVLYDVRQDKRLQEYNLTYLLFGLDIMLLILIYLLVLKMVSPLKKISQTMKTFSQGNLDVRTQIKSNDEIGKVSENFNLMADKLQHTLLSKETLLREVGHELKTPIARGKFALNALDASKQKRIITDAFDELEKLTDAILQEKLLDEEVLHITTFKASTLIIQTLSKLTIDEEDINVTIEDFEIKGDLYYLEMALKNLVENALKYTDRVPITLIAKKQSLDIYSYGKPLEHTLNYYLEPFTQQNRDSIGFGLGLNIVQKIVEKHGFTLTYQHKNGANIFTLLCSNAM